MSPQCSPITCLCSQETKLIFPLQRKSNILLPLKPTNEGLIPEQKIPTQWRSSVQLLSRSKRTASSIAKKRKSLRGTTVAIVIFIINVHHHKMLQHVSKDCQEQEKFIEMFPLKWDSKWICIRTSRRRYRRITKSCQRNKGVSFEDWTLFYFFCMVQRTLQRKSKEF